MREWRDRVNIISRVASRSSGRVFLSSRRAPAHLHYGLLQRRPETIFAGDPIAAHPVAKARREDLGEVH